MQDAGGSLYLTELASHVYIADRLDESQRNGLFTRGTRVWDDKACPFSHGQAVPIHLAAWLHFHSVHFC